MADVWNLQGELVLSCNCTVFCPCVLSLGQAPPTEGYCQTWGGIRIDAGRFNDIDLAGIKVGLVIEIPGLMSRGNWTAALFIDDNAPIQAVETLTRIFTGRVGGSTHLLSILVGRFLGVQQAPITYRVEGQTRIFSIDKIVDGVVTPVKGKGGGDPVVIRNSEYWISPDIIVAKADKSRMHAFGRNWNFAGRSAEICRLDWSSN
jgi:hypothetical protein